MEHIIRQFDLRGTIVRAEPYGAGHINDTYRLRNSDPGAPDYLLQCINHHVFPDVDGLMENIRRVTDHLRRRIAAAPPPAGTQTTLTVNLTHEGRPYCHVGGEYFRVFEFLDGLHAYELVDSPERAYAGARAYGYFLRFLDDFPADLLTPVIPGFHDLALRLRQLAAARAAPARGRVAAAADALRRAEGMADRLLTLDTAYRAGRIRRRVTHNDAKFSNVLLTPAGWGKCVVDLDTVMPGAVHFDFGDGVRSGAATAREDEPDLDRVTVDLEKFRAFAAGYLEVTRDVLSPAELDFLGLSGAYMAYIMGVRFLTDFLAGDVYYKVRSPEHNLLRARNQLRLAEEFLTRLPELDAIVRQ
ncbi:phosphotransferase enzyme family protein [Lewinella sp. IMCC34183]|uniref:phosphotransferase enzyme family protein n=1 Tax=Lewinella sp. IMCC34183 TaxID=2248762 RepID=UPI000E24F1AF|nr:aminoglycoside phosphotransferase family protein [Lewinella sp. IMCC34183]